MSTQAITQAALSCGMFPLTQNISYGSFNRLTKDTISNDSAKGCTTQLGNGNYSEDYAYDSATGNLFFPGDHAPASSPDSWRSALRLAVIKEPY
jgi:hypothetical protein